MKYLFITTLKAFACCLSLLLISNLVLAQKNTESPYSRYGVGLLEHARYNGNFASGGIGIAWRPYQYKPIIYDSLAKSNARLNDRGTNYINPKNPASFSNISLTTFEAGVLSKNVNYSSAEQSQVSNSTQLSHVAFAFPIGSKWGLGFGINPYSSVGYNYQVSGSTNNVGINYLYDGSGGINEIFIATAAELGKNFSVGISGNYLFGSILDNRRIIYENSTNFFNTLDQRDTDVNSFNFDIGLQYFKDINKDYRFIAGFLASPLEDLNATQSRIVRNYTGQIDSEKFKDTALFVENNSTDISIYPKYGVGFAFEKKLNWILSIDYAMQIKNQAAHINNESITFNDNHLINIGFEKYNNISAFGSYLKQMGYRAGFNYNSSLLTIDGEDIQEFGISFGVSMPLRKSFSTLNFGLEAGRRGSNEKNLTQENFLNFQIGVTINDKWFIQRKYD